MFKALIFGCKTEKHKKKDKIDKAPDADRAAEDMDTETTPEETMMDGENTGESSGEEALAIC